MKNQIVKPTVVYEEAKKRLYVLQEIRKDMQETLKQPSEGKIHIVSSGNKISYYLRKKPSDTTGIYISQKETDKIRILLQKNYDEKMIRLVEQEIRNLEKLLEKAADLPGKMRDIYTSYPEKARRSIQPYDIDDDLFVKAWLAMPYEKKLITDNVPNFITDNDEHVRSKTELNIANMLLKNGIPYKYECPFYLNSGYVIYPDFTTLDIQSRRLKYWEHRGMMDDPEYAKHSVKRLRDFEANNVRLGEDLIITEETAGCPLGTTEIQRIIDNHYHWHR